MFIVAANIKNFKRRSWLTVSPTSPIQINLAYTFGWSGAKMETNGFTMAAKLKYKRTLITKMLNKFPQPAPFSLVLT